MRLLKFYKKHGTRLQSLILITLIENPDKEFCINSLYQHLKKNGHEFGKQSYLNALKSLEREHIIHYVKDPRHKRRLFIKLNHSILTDWELIRDEKATILNYGLDLLYLYKKMRKEIKKKKEFYLMFFSLYEILKKEITDVITLLTSKLVLKTPKNTTLIPSLERDFISFHLFRICIFWNHSCVSRVAKWLIRDVQKDFPKVRAMVFIQYGRNVGRSVNLITFYKKTSLGRFVLKENPQHVLEDLERVILKAIHPKGETDFLSKLDFEYMGHTFMFLLPYFPKALEFWRESFSKKEDPELRKFRKKMWATLLKEWDKVSGLTLKENPAGRI